MVSKGGRQYEQTNTQAATRNHTHTLAYTHLHLCLVQPLLQSLPLTHHTLQQALLLLPAVEEW